jgi:5-formyltetrahydrofolate cyclo-ligase
VDRHQKKEELRQNLLERREAIPEPDYYSLSADIVEELKKQDEFRAAQIIHCYVSMNQRREVETRELIREILFKGKQVIVPVTDFENRTLSHVRLRSYEDLQTNKWGVLEPNGGEEVSPNEIELVVVPMVAADEECNRIGYGEGFYDRFLKQMNCPKIGLIFDRNVIEKLPVEEFDIPLNKVITETRIIHRN